MGVATASRKEWPLLAATTKLGKTKYWQVRVFLHGELALLETEYWQDDGAHQSAAKKIEPKNVGRSNETSPYDQAVSEAESLWKKQQDKGYADPKKPKVATLPLPMLAHDFNKRGKSIIYPAYAQPKLDGFRCLYKPGTGFWSRQGKIFSDTVDLSHLEIKDKSSYIFDGELILPQPYTFQETAAAIKKQRETTPLLQFHVFDLITHGEELTFEERRSILNSYTPKAPKSWTFVETVEVAGLSDIQDHHARWTAESYEGAIIRNKEGLYLIGHRSADLQKYKDFLDDEFEVVAVNDGVGREEGAAILRCKTKDGKEFDVRPRGDYPSRQAMYKKRKQLIGKSFTVRFQNYSDEGIPRFPVGILVREDWDQ